MLVALSVAKRRFSPRNRCYSASLSHLACCDYWSVQHHGHRKDILYCKKNLGGGAILMILLRDAVFYGPDHQEYWFMGIRFSWYGEPISISDALWCSSSFGLCQHNCNCSSGNHIAHQPSRNLKMESTLESGSSHFAIQRIYLESGCWTGCLGVDAVNSWAWLQNEKCIRRLSFSWDLGSVANAEMSKS